MTSTDKIKNKKNFIKIFVSADSLSKELTEKLDCIYIDKIQFFADLNEINIELIADEYINGSQMCELKIFFCYFFNKDKNTKDENSENKEGIIERKEKKIDVNFFMKYTEKIAFSDVYNDFMGYAVHCLCEEKPFCKGVLAEFSCALKDNRLNIKLSSVAADLLKQGKCDEIIQEMIRKSFDNGINGVRVNFLDALPNDKQKEEYFTKKEIHVNNIVEAANAANAVAKREKSKADMEKNNTADEDYDAAKVIFGKKIDPGESVMNINDITPEESRVVVTGEVIEVKDIVEYTQKSDQKKKCRCIFSITDKTNSITVKLFTDTKHLENLTENVKKGSILKIKGDVQYDSYSKETGLMAKCIVKGALPKREDTAAEKRVELHLHTKMSKMDAVTSAEDLVNRAVDFGHKAIAITDHGVVQSYPNAFTAAKKAKKSKGKEIKIIY